jgi:diguanylate cyclase (GGDEF)-like protein
VGDRALCEVARVLRTAIRPYDICVRYAGDEFILVLSGCSSEEAARKHGDLQKTIADTSCESSPGVQLSLSVSVGVAMYPDDGDAYEKLLAAADRRMYTDKTRQKRRAASGTADPTYSEGELASSATGVL